MTAAALNDTLDVAPALANLNFDFSPWKIEAPKEFDGVVSALSSVRRQKAENGMPHATARKLGTLFESILPPTPNLTRAYGQQASEISRTSSLSPETQSTYGAFSGRVGLDAISIWAAAISSIVAIAIYLLACLLVRMWERQEVTALWAEIVQKRKNLIQAEMGEKSAVEIASLAATRQEITRAQLAEWDASARSWLRTADLVKSRQQKQLILILDNVKGSVNMLNDPYDSVLTAWKHPNPNGRPHRGYLSTGNWGRYSPCIISLAPIHGHAYCRASQDYCPSARSNFPIWRSTNNCFRNAGSRA